MNVTFHEIMSFFVSPLLQGKSNLSSSHYLLLLRIYKFKKPPMKNSSLKKPTMSGREKPLLWKVNKRREKLTLVPQQVQLFELVVSISKNPTKEEKGSDHLLGILFLKLFVQTISLYNIRVFFLAVIDTIKTLISVYEKERVVVNEYTQTYEIDYEKIFALLAKINTKNYSFHNVKNVFLHGDLRKEVYMKIFLGFYSHEEKKKVCKLNKALYGLKKFLRVWFERFTQSHDIPRIKVESNGKLIFLLIYLDDMIIASDWEIKKLTLKKLATQFEMEELEKLKNYILELLKEIEKLGCKTLKIPIEQNNRIRPDITYVISVVSQLCTIARKDAFRQLKGSFILIVLTTTIIYKWAQYIHTTLKGCKKLSHIEGNDPPRDDPKFEAMMT
ncbi:Copia protein, partial [Mucuna pruriens]